MLGQQAEQFLALTQSFHRPALLDNPVQAVGDELDVGHVARLVGAFFVADPQHADHVVAVQNRDAEQAPDRGGAFRHPLDAAPGRAVPADHRPFEPDAIHPRPRLPDRNRHAFLSGQVHVQLAGPRFQDHRFPVVGENVEETHPAVGELDRLRQDVVVQVAVGKPRRIFIQVQQETPPLHLGQQLAFGFLVGADIHRRDNHPLPISLAPARQKHPPADRDRLAVEGLHLKIGFIPSAPFRQRDQFLPHHMAPFLFERERRILQEGLPPVVLEEIQRGRVYGAHLHQRETGMHLFRMALEVGPPFDDPGGAQRVQAFFNRREVLLPHGNLDIRKDIRRGFWFSPGRGNGLAQRRLPFFRPGRFWRCR